MFKYFIFLFILFYIALGSQPSALPQSAAIKKKNDRPDKNSFHKDEKNRQQSGADQNQRSAQESGDEPLTRFIPIPITFYSPETSVGLGLSFIYLDYTGKSEQASFPETLSAVVLYTFNKQFLSALSYKNLLGHEQYAVKGTGAFSYFPKKFYGIGSDTQKSDEEDYTLQKSKAEFIFQKQIMKKFFIGPGIKFYDFLLEDIDEQIMLNDLITRQGRKGYAGGAGFYIDLDWRDNPFSTRQGFYANFSFLMFPRSLSNHYKFNEMILDLRGFIPLSWIAENWKDVVALQFYLQGVNQSPPFIFLPEMGGANLMRGIYQGRFRDNIFFTLQFEYRFLMFHPLGLVLFGSAGKVGQEPHALQHERVKMAGGLGLRYFFAKARGVALRLDIGFSQDDKGVYINLLEAF